MLAIKLKHTCKHYNLIEHTVDENAVRGANYVELDSTAYWSGNPNVDLININPVIEVVDAWAVEGDTTTSYFNIPYPSLARTGIFWPPDEAQPAFGSIYSVQYLTEAGVVNPESACPKCFGKGYYYDCEVDNLGILTKIVGDAKLRQELEKITLTQKGNNRFHLAYGLDRNVFGLVDPSFVRTRIRAALIIMLKHFNLLQKEADAGGQFLPDTEYMDGVKGIEVIVDNTDPRYIEARVDVITASGAQIGIVAEISF